MYKVKTSTAFKTKLDIEELGDDSSSIFFERGVFRWVMIGSPWENKFNFFCPSEDGGTAHVDCILQKLTSIERKRQSKWIHSWWLHTTRSVCHRLLYESRRRYFQISISVLSTDPTVMLHVSSIRERTAEAKQWRQRTPCEKNSST